MFDKILHQYSTKANHTFEWLPMDTEKRYSENVANRYDELVKFGWLDKKFSYKFNNYGFRSDEFSNEPSMVSLGCSYTCGIGLPLENCWASIVSNSLNLKNFNLGIGASSNDTAFRMAHHWLPQLKPKVVVHLVTHRHRFEYHDNNSEIHNLSSWSNSQLWKIWALNDINSDMNMFKNTLAIQNICNNLGIKLIQIEFEKLNFKIVGNDLARDLSHRGVKTNQNIAEHILSKIMQH
jgi:hypothetical protein